MNEAGVCQKCATGKFLGSSCSDTCSDAIFWIDGTKINTCATQTGALIATKKENGTDKMNLVCKSNYLTVLKLDGDGTNVNWWKSTTATLNPNDLENTAPIFNIADRQQEVTCTTYTSPTSYTLNGTASTTTVSNQGTTKSDRQVV